MKSVDIRRLKQSQIIGITSCSHFFPNRILGVAEKTDVSNFYQQNRTQYVYVILSFFTHTCSAFQEGGQFKA